MIRAAIAGLGWWGKHMVRRMAGSDVLLITTGIDVKASHAAFAREHGLAFALSVDDVLADPAIDAVILCTPHSLHTGQVLAAASAGKHVFCEKPLALSRADAERSVAACREAGVVLGIGHERRLEPAMVDIHRFVKSGELGTIMHVEANFSHDKLANVPHGDWRTSIKEAPAAGMTAMGIHLTDAFIHMLGPIREVFAATASRVAYKDNGDVISVLMRFASGATGYLNAILVTPLCIRLTVFGSGAWVEACNQTHPDTPGPTTLTLHRRDGTRDVRNYQWVDTVRQNLDLFARACEGTAVYPFTDEEKIANIATLEAICQSAADNQPVGVEG
jgi:predicted dehydrogenase